MSSPRKSFSLNLLGGCVLEDATGSLTGRAVQRRRLACLALVGAAGRGGATRDQLVAYLWPESDAEQARHLLSDTLYVLRSALGEDALLAPADRVVLNPDVVACDATAFQDALRRGDPAGAVEAYGGPFLDGFHISDAPEFERWVDRERERHDAAHARALEELAEAADREGSPAALAWWRRLAAARPYDGRIARRVATALAATGDPAGAIRQIEAHAGLLREELGIEPDTVLLELAEALRRRGRDQAGGTGGAAAAAPAGGGDTDAAGDDAPAPGEAAAPAPGAGVASPARRRPSRQRVAFAALALLAALTAAGGLYRRGRRPGDASPTDPSPRAIAVLPFDNVGGEPRNEYFSDGIAEEILNALAQVPELRVVGRTSSFAFKGRTEDLVGIGSRLHVGTLVEGSVQREGGRLRVTVRLIDARTGYDLWGARYDRSAAGIFAIEDEIAASLAQQLRVRLPLPPAELAKGRTTDLRAYDAYLKGLEGLNSRTRDRLEEAVHDFGEAVTLDSTFAAAYAGLASAYGVLSGYQFLSVDEAMTPARAAAARALALDDASPAAHTAAGSVAGQTDDWADAERQYRRAIALRPSFALAHSWLGSGLAAQGRVEEGTRELRRAAELDPLSPGIFAGLSLALSATGDSEGAVRAAWKSVELDSAFADAHMNLAGALAAEGRTDDALPEARKAVDLTAGHGPEELATLGAVYARAGHPRRAREVLSRLEHLDRSVPPLGSEALVWANLGEPDTAFALLGRCSDIATNYRMWLVTAPLWDPLRSDPRWPGAVRHALTR